jgi:hypothetical protein
MRVMLSHYFETKLPNLKLKTLPKQLLVSLPLDIALSDLKSNFSTLQNGTKMK